VTVVDPNNMSVQIEGIESVQGDVISVIPPQRAADLAVKAGLVADIHQYRYVGSDTSTIEGVLLRAAEADQRRPCGARPDYRR
jgi:hypothetical protein